MTGELIIDSADVYTSYGVYVTGGGWNDLVAFPPLKAVKYNDWHEYDGIEADLSDPVLGSKEVKMRMAVTGDYDGFMEMMFGSAYHTFECAAIGRTFRLRMNGEQNLSSAGTLGTFTLRLMDDSPMIRSGHTRQSPTSPIPQSDAYKIDGVRLSDYGVKVLAGTLDEIRKSPSVKLNLLRDIASSPGVLYDGAGGVTLQGSEMRMNCLMRAGSLTEFWRNRDTLLYDLIQPGERQLYVSATGGTVKCHYKDCSVSEFEFDGSVWARFTLTLTRTGGREN